jgi:predicted nucleotidyltransferase
MRNHKKIKKIIQRISEKIEKEYQPEKIILFGSYAWGRPNRHSDIDFFIIKKTKERHIDRSVRVRRILREENAVVPMDPIVYTPAETKRRIRLGDDFIAKIITQGVVLYG